MEIQGKTVLITGASSGMGAATAKAMARTGGRVLLLARRKAALEELAKEIQDAGGVAHVYPVDLTQADEVARERPTSLSTMPQQVAHRQNPCPSLGSARTPINYPSPAKTAPVASKPEPKDLSAQTLIVGDPLFLGRSVVACRHCQPHAGVVGHRHVGQQR